MRTAESQMDPVPDSPDSSPTAQVPGGRLVVRLLLAVYTAAVTVIAFWPVPVDQGMRVGVLRFAAFVRANGFIGLQYEHIEFTANLLMFIPLGLLLTLALRPRPARWVPPLAGFVASMLIELVQFTLLPQRFTTVSDVIANTIGGALGWLIALAVVRLANPKVARQSGAFEGS
jgi:glycopeptide antibiotics resistance protein